MPGPLSILGLVKVFAQLGIALTRMAYNRQLISAGEAKAAIGSLKAAGQVVDRARRARASARAGGDDGVLDDPAARD